MKTLSGGFRREEKMEERLLEMAEHKAGILIDALPYIRDFNHKIVVIEYGCRKYLSPVAEQVDAGYCTFEDGRNEAGCYSRYSDGSR